MRIRRLAAQLGIVVAFAATVSAQSYAPTPEFKCMAKTSKLGATFLASKTKCVTKCVQNVWKGLGFPPAECFAPYGGVTASCIADPLKSVETKFSLGIRTACDPTYKVGTACPSCYSGGDCGPSGEAVNHVAYYENQIDAFYPILFCELTPTPFLLEMRCMKTASKGVVKYFAKAARCYDKCFGLAQKGLIPSSACGPPATDPMVLACLADARDSYVKYIDHDCGPPPASPDGCGSPYPTATEWVDAVDTMLNGDVALTYCNSPSGAFLD
jgi:hypothetical protein